MSQVVPNEWLVAVLGACAQNVNGARRPISLSKRALISGSYPYLGATGQIDSLNDYTHDGEHILVGEDGANLVTKSKNLSFIFDGKFWVNNHAHAIKCVAGVPAKYLSNYINSLDLKPFVTGSAQPKLTKTNLDKIPVPMAPLAEQKEIVAQLDKLLAQVESTKARLDAIPAISKRFRQSVLAAAVSGKLTEEWRKENKCEPLADYKKVCMLERAQYYDRKIKKLVGIEVFPNFKLPDSWVWQSLDESSIRITDGTHFSPVSTPSGDYMYITSKNVRAGYMNLSKITYVDKATHMEIYQRCDVKKGDVLYVKDGANTGLACVNNISEEISLLSSVGVFKTCSFVNSKYLEHYLNSPLGRKLMLEMMGGTAIPRLTLTKLAKAPFALPPIQEQVEIVRRVEELFAYADKIEAQVNAAQQRVNNLTQSILAKAFSGELTAKWREQNPDLISGENSAAALLEKIKDERAAITVKKKLTKRKKVAKKIATKKIVPLAKELSNPVERVLAEEGPLSPQQIFDKLANDLSLTDVFAEIAKLLADNQIEEITEDGVKALSLTL